MLLKKPLKLGFSVWGAILISLPTASVSLAQTKNSLQTNLSTPETRPWDFDWKLQTAGESYDEGQDSEETYKSSKLFESKFSFKFNYHLNESLLFDLQPAVKFQSGRVQSLDGADNPGNSFSLRQAAVQWNPWTALKLSAGALNQGEIHTHLVSDELAFPGARLGLYATPDTWTLGVIGDASIPTSNSLETNTNEIEPTPTKTAGQILVNWEPKPYLFGKTRAGYFSYNKLPTDVASASKLLGNTTEALTQEESRFAYEYQGYEAATDWQLPLLRRLDLLFYAEGAQNQSAPTGKNMGYSVGGGLRWLINSKHDLTFEGRRFRVESDVAPAYFSNRENLRTNRVGYDIASKWHLKKQKFSIGFLYREAQVLTESTSQGHGRIYQINLETDYGSL